DLARKKIADLEAFQARALDELDALERASSIDGLPIEFSRPLTLLYRYELACHRRLESAHKQLTSGRRGKPEAPKPAPRPPAPRNGEDLRRDLKRDLVEKFGYPPNDVVAPPPPAPAPAPAP